MDAWFHPIFTLADLIYAAVNAAFALCFFLLRLPEHQYLHNDRVCRYFILGNYTGVTVFSLVRALAPLVPGGDSLETQTALSLNVVSCVSYFLPLAFITLINARDIRTRFSAGEFIVFCVLVLVQLLFLFLPGFDLAARVVFWIFFLFYLTQLVRAGLLIINQTSWIKKRMENYFSGKEEVYFTWFIPVTILMLVCGVVAALEFLVPSWFLLLVQLALSVVAAVLLAVYFLNNLFIFKFFEPVIAAIEAERSYRYSKLIGLDVDALVLQLDRSMRRHKPYTNAQLTIADVAKMIKLNVHQTSELINARMKTSFRQYINAFRVEEAKEYLKTANGELSIIDVAFACGFNSKSTFNAIFLGATGKTPSQWRDEAQNVGGSRPKAAQREPAR